MPEPELFQEANRQLTICNACRYCQGYCAVFPALELRRDLSKGDILYLAHLCHDCRACLYACMYSPPHEFAVDLPRVMTDVRMASYQRWTWPAALAKVFADARIGIILCASSVIVAVTLTVLLIRPGQLIAKHQGPGAFYEIVPYYGLVIPGMVLFCYAISMWLRGALRFWSEAGCALSWSTITKSIGAAMIDALSLRNLKGGGPGCYYPEQQASPLRRLYHCFVSWGFLAAFVSTSIAAVYQEFFHWLPPYPLTSAPVIFGSFGGISMIIGVIGLLWLKFKSDPAPAQAAASSLDLIFLVTIGLASLTGMLTLILRNTSVLGSILTIHLGTVAAIFVTAPYGKFVHFYSHGLALIRNRVEQR
jgi:citrate/tricarballylate utilization protein